MLTGIGVVEVWEQEGWRVANWALEQGHKRGAFPNESQPQGGCFTDRTSHYRFLPKGSPTFWTLCRIFGTLCLRNSRIWPIIPEQSIACRLDCGVPSVDWRI